jgi:hypothetical protein
LNAIPILDLQVAGVTARANKKQNLIKYLS